MSIVNEFVRPSYMPKYVPVGSCRLYLPGQDDAQSSTIRDRSGYGNNGTITSATWERLGSGLWCLAFGGTDDWVKCGTDSSLNFTSGNFSIKAWIYHDDLGTSDFMFSRGEWQIDGWDVRLLLNNGDVSFRIFQVGAQQETISNQVVAAATWTHIVVVRSGTTGIIYINGADQSKTQPAITNPVTSTREFTIGTYAAGATTAEWDGKMALWEVRNVAMTATQALGSYSQERHLFSV